MTIQLSPVPCQSGFAGQDLPYYRLHFSVTVVSSCGHVISVDFPEEIWTEVMFFSSDPRLLKREFFPECFLSDFTGCWQVSVWSTAFHLP